MKEICIDVKKIILLLVVSYSLFLNLGLNSHLEADSFLEYEELAPNSVFNYIHSKALSKNTDTPEITLAKASFIEETIDTLRSYFLTNQSDIETIKSKINRLNLWNNEIRILWNTYQIDQTSRYTHHYIKFEINGKIRQLVFFDEKYKDTLKNNPKFGIEDKDLLHLDRGYWLYRPDDIIDYTIDWTSFEDGKDHIERRGIDHRNAILNAIQSKVFLSETIKNIHQNTAIFGKRKKQFELLFDAEGNIKFESIRKIKIELGSKGSQKQTYRITIHTKHRLVLQFAIKITINKAVRTGFRENELQHLKNLSSTNRVPVFGSSIKGSITDVETHKELNYELYSEQWIHGKTIAQLRGDPWMNLDSLQTIIASWMVIANELGQSARGKWIMVEDIQPPNMMVLLDNHGEVLMPVAVDIGNTIPRAPQDILNDLYRHYSIFFEDSHDTSDIARAVFIGISRGLGFDNGIALLIDAYEKFSQQSIEQRPIYYRSLEDYLNSVQTSVAPVLIDHSPTLSPYESIPAANSENHLSLAA